MSELTLTAIRLGFLAVLWLFVITAVSVMRSDLFGQRSAPRPASPAPREAKQQRRAKQPKQPKQPKPPKSKSRQGAPSKLVVTQGALAGTAVSLGQSPVTIGRAADSTLVISDDYASSRHARLFPRDGTWVVEDLGSTNGTFLDRSKVQTPTPVPLGVPIRIGKTVLELRR
ncbi:MAG: FHA domain-containing protein FhaB/FipA [Actinomycetes bacterium]